MDSILIAASGVIASLALAAFVFTLWGVRWGARQDECSMAMPGDVYFVDTPREFVAMTRAVTIEAPAETVWPWLAQLGRGAGWYSYDFLDNGAKMSAKHLVTWVPPPRKGDASPIGYLRHIATGSELTWWVPGARFGGSLTRLTVDMKLTGDGPRSRLVIRMSADASGATALFALWTFRFIDSIMARRQLLGIRERAERYGTRTVDRDHPETGTRDQYQLYEVIYASGERAGTRGKERAEDWRRAAIETGLVTDGEHGAG